MTVEIRIAHAHHFRWYLLLKGMKRIGLRYAFSPEEGIIVGDASSEVVSHISTIVGIESIEPVAELAAGSFIS